MKTLGIALWLTITIFLVAGDCESDAWFYISKALGVLSMAAMYLCCRKDLPDYDDADGR